MSEWTKALFFLSLVLMLILEVLRMRLIRRFNLHLPRQAAWQESYYGLYAFACFALVPFSTYLLYKIEQLWGTAQQHPYGIVLFLLVRAGLIVCLLGIALHKIMPISGTFMVFVVVGMALDLVLFLICQETRILFGATLLVLVTSAVGKPMRFTDWPGLLAWLKKERPGRDARVLLLVQEEAVLSRNPKYLFSIGLNFVGELEKQQVSVGLREQFQRHGMPLTPKAVVEAEEEGSRWVLVDGDAQYFVRWEEEIRYFFLRRQGQALNVYESRGDRTFISTKAADAMPSERERQRVGLIQYVNWRMAHFVQQRWAEWQALREAGRSPAEIGLFLYLGIQDEFLPGWSSLLDELAQIVAWLPEQIALGPNAPGDEDSRQMRIRGLLQKKLTPMLLDVTETNLASAHATYLNGTARWLRNRVTVMILRDWEQVSTWAAAVDRAEGRREIRRWLAGELLPGSTDGLRELVVIANDILSRLEAEAPNGPTSDQIAGRTAEAISERLPQPWLDFVSMLSDQVAAYREPHTGDRWTEQLIDNARLEMIAQAVQQMGDRQDLLRKTMHVVSANLGWFGALNQQMSQEQDWNQQVIDTRTAEMRSLVDNAVAPMTDEVRAQMTEAVEAIAAAEENIARIGPLTRSKIERFLSAQLLPRWEGDLQGLAQGISRILPELAAEQTQLLPPEERLPLVRTLLERELPSSWQGLLDKITSTVEENLLRLTELQRERVMGKEVVAPLQDLLKGSLDRWQPQHMFHWVYDVPEGDSVAVLYAPRVPPFEVKPRIEFDEYLGLFLTYLQKRLQGRERRRPV